MRKQFHFILSKNFKRELIYFTKKIKMNLSDTIVYIINIMIPLLDKNFFKNNKKSFGSKKIGEPVSECRIYLEKSLYLKLKLIHGTKQTFSIAMLIRELLKHFLIGIKRFGLVKLERAMSLYYSIFVKKIINKTKNKKSIINIHMDINYNNLINLKLLFCNKYILQGFEFI